jgi:hypothetical protein
VTWPWRQIAVTLAVGGVLLALALALVDLLAVDVFLVVFAPIVVLALVRVRPALHWGLLAVILAATAIVLVQTDRSDSSTAGFGVIVVPLLLVAGVLLTAVVDRFVRHPGRRGEPAA